MATFPYFAFPSKTKRKIYFPALRVRLCYKHSRLTDPILALIDSGAEVSYCLKDIGTWLGVGFSKRKLFISRAADKHKFRGYKDEVSLFIAGEKINLPIIFTQNLSFPIILGRKVFFKNFKITFEEYKYQFTLNFHKR